MNEKVRIVYGIHIMWYEYALIAEHFASVKHAYLPMKEFVDLELRVFANKQTYLETPDRDGVMDMFEEEIKSALFDEPWAPVDLTWITDEEPFYCMADQRREVTNPEGWVVQGETDCLLPQVFFKALSDAATANVFTDPTYALTWAYRKMWDFTWNHVEHPLFRMAEYQNTDIPLADRPRGCRYPYDFRDYISQDVLDEFNKNYPTAEIMRVIPPKLDGSLLAFWRLEEKLIPDDMHIGTDDLCAMRAMDILGIPQYHIINVIKGHNYNHPLKRLGTSSTRDDTAYLKHKEESQEAMERFISELLEQEGV